MKENTTIKIKSTGFSSQRYGNCPYCGKPASEVFVKNYYKKYKRPDGSSGITRDCVPGPSYGHKECLEHNRK